MKRFDNELVIIAKNLGMRLISALQVDTVGFGRDELPLELGRLVRYIGIRELPIVDVAGLRSAWSERHREGMAYAQNMIMGKTSCKLYSSRLYYTAGSAEGCLRRNRCCPRFVAGERHGRESEEDPDRAEEVKETVCRGSGVEQDVTCIHACSRSTHLSNALLQKSSTLLTDNKFAICRVRVDYVSSLDVRRRPRDWRRVEERWTGNLWRNADVDAEEIGTNAELLCKPEAERYAPFTAVNTCTKALAKDPGSPEVERASQAVIGGGGEDEGSAAGSESFHRRLPVVGMIGLGSASRLLRSLYCLYMSPSSLRCSSRRCDQGPESPGYTTRLQVCALMTESMQLKPSRPPVWTPHGWIVTLLLDDDLNGEQYVPYRAMARSPTCLQTPYESMRVTLLRHVQEEFYSVVLRRIDRSPQLLFQSRPMTSWRSLVLRVSIRDFLCETGAGLQAASMSAVNPCTWIWSRVIYGCESDSSTPSRLRRPARAAARRRWFWRPVRDSHSPLFVIAVAPLLSFSDPRIPPYSNFNLLATPLVNGVQGGLRKVPAYTSGPLCHGCDCLVQYNFRRDSPCKKSSTTVFTVNSTW
ncbi:hypothetical protein BD311DRAFT_778297 [Dichomitus squalens]|uniref:Uncharacterized protein n=1 Tax=Dichomitus squalens TaxID=114155 RepID=A0A4Q9MLA5_9APHY|nr:hypothetical protein BD311DRAFT_778297 [Dichomitus squalens]